VNASEILNAVETARAKQPLACSIHTFGFGSDHDALLLKAIADKVGGVYFFIQDKDQIADAFTDCLGGLLSVVGQNIALQVQPVEGVNITGIKTAFKVTKRENNVLTVHLGDIQSEEEKDVLIGVSVGSLPSVPEPNFHSSLINVHLDYFNVITSKQEELTLTASIPRPPAADHPITPAYKVDQQKNRITAAEALIQARVHGDKKDYETGRKVLQNAIEVLQKSISHEDLYVQSLIADMTKAIAGLKDQSSYTSHGSYSLSSIASSHHQQRSTTATRSYMTSTRSTMRSLYDDQ